jgi:hypothetical protein
MKLEWKSREGFDTSCSPEFEDIVKLVQHQSRTVLDWLTLVDYALRRSDFISRRQAGTGQWLIDSGGDNWEVEISIVTFSLLTPPIIGRNRHLAD